MSTRSSRWKAMFHNAPAAATPPTAGTMTATSVTSLLIRLVPGRTVARRTGGAASLIAYIFAAIGVVGSKLPERGLGAPDLRRSEPPRAAPARLHRDTRASMNMLLWW